MAGEKEHISIEKFFINLKINFDNVFDLIDQNHSKT